MSGRQGTRQRSTPRRGGRVRIILAALLVPGLTACPDSATDPPAPVPVASMSGRVETVDGTSAAGTTVMGRWGDLEATAEVDADGRFELGLTAVPQEGGFLEVRPQPDLGAVPALVRLDEPLPTDETRILLLPSTWTIRRGVYAGTTVPIHPADAADGKVLPSYWGFVFAFQQDSIRQVVVDSSRWVGGLVSWPPIDDPIPVALDREGSTTAPTAADSVALWRALDRLEAVLGRDLFRRARMAELPAPDPDTGGFIEGAITVRLDGGLGVRGRAFPHNTIATWLYRADVGAWSGSGVSRVGVVSSDIRGGRILIRDSAAVADPALVMHEAMHILGPGHGCVWRSIQTFCESLSAEEPTAEDVAYLEVLEAARERENELGTMHGILPAIFGERSLVRGLPPIPGVEVVDASKS